MLAGEHRSEFLIVLGDFNTPADSAFFRPLRAFATNAFEVAGSGCAATWPMPLPVLSLDQMWTTGRLRAVRCEHMLSWRSDHRAVRAEFDFAP
jgi:endonuclease/exonuclease/phosphatase (EEP) superfamily protein YafD